MKKFLHCPLAGLGVLAFAAASSSAQNLLLVRSGDKADDHLGIALGSLGDLDGDGRQDWAAGAPEDANVFNYGEGFLRAYSGATGATLFTLNGSVLTDAFGSAVGSVGDLTGDGRPEFVVGAPGAGGDVSGRVFVHPASGGPALFTIAGLGPNDQLGLAVAGCGDVNADGKPDFIAGAPLAANGGTQRGYARVYSGLNGLPLHTLNGLTDNDRLGTSVCGLGDVNADGKADFVVGSSRAGARIYSGANAAVLRSFPSPTNDRLGLAVAALSDLDGDGIRELALGAPQDGSVFAPGLGYVNVHSGATGVLLFTLSGAVSGDRFGGAVADGRDLTGDGRSEIVVGADQFSSGGAGYVRVFDGNGGALLWTLNGVTAGERFGYSVAGLGDLNGDGRGEFALGVPNRSTAFGLAGQAEVWSSPGGCPAPSSYCTATSNSSGGPALMGFAGSTSVSNNNFVLQTSGTPPNKLALYAYGPNQANTPAGNGFLCIGSPLVRLPAIMTTAGGTATYPLNVNTLPPAGPIHSGDVRNFVLWFRDPPAGGANYNFSNGLSVTFCP